MGIVTRYVLRQIAIPSILAVVAVAVVGVANELQMMDRQTLLPMEQMTLGDVSRLGFYLLPKLVPYLVPITYMLGILMAFGQLSQNSEIVAMKAAGIPLKRIVIPVIVVGGILSVLCLLVQDRVQPWAMGKALDLVRTELPLRATLDALPTGIMQEFGDWRVYIGHKHSEDNGHGGSKTILDDIIVVKPEENGAPATYYADSAYVTTENDQTWLCMTSAHLVPPSESGHVMRSKFDAIRLPVPKMAANRSSASRSELTLAELYDSMKIIQEQVNATHSEPLKLELFKQRHEFGERLSLPFACLAVCFAAAPLGARAQRSGRSYAFAVGFSIMLGYYVLYMLERWVLLPLPLWGVIGLAWMPNVVFCGAGIAFLWRVDRV